MVWARLKRLPTPPIRPPRLFFLKLIQPKRNALAIVRGRCLRLQLGPNLFDPMLSRARLDCAASRSSTVPVVRRGFAFRPPRRQAFVACGVIRISRGLGRVEYVLGSVLQDGPVTALANAQVSFPAGIQVASLFGFSAVSLHELLNLAGKSLARRVQKGLRSALPVTPWAVSSHQSLCPEEAPGCAVSSVCGINEYQTCIWRIDTVTARLKPNLASPTLVRRTMETKCFWKKELKRSHQQ